MKAITNEEFIDVRNEVAKLTSEEVKEYLVESVEEISKVNTIIEEQVIPVLADGMDYTQAADILKPMDEILNGLLRAGCLYTLLKLEEEKTERTMP